MPEAERPKSRGPSAPLKTPLNASPRAKCKFCHKEFSKKKSWQKFCSLKCKNSHWNIEKILSEGNR